MAPDGSIKSTYYDTRETHPTWATPFEVVIPDTPFGLMAAVSSAPDTLAVFWVTISGAVMTSSYTLMSQPIVSRGSLTQIVIPSERTTPFAIENAVAEWSGNGFAAVSSGQGSVTLFWLEGGR